VYTLTLSPGEAMTLCARANIIMYRNTAKVSKRLVCLLVICSVYDISPTATQYVGAKLAIFSHISKKMSKKVCVFVNNSYLCKKK
jgi:hypothetical protein